MDCYFSGEWQSLFLLHAAFLTSVNELADAHRTHISVGMQQRMPVVFWLTHYKPGWQTMVFSGLNGRAPGALVFVDLPVLYALFFGADAGGPSRPLEVNQQSLNVIYKGIAGSSLSCPVKTLNFSAKAQR